MGNPPETGSVEAWLDHIATDRAMSPNTVRTYARSLRTLPDAPTATIERVEAWWHERAGLSSASRVNELSAVRAFYSWLVLYGHRDDNPTRRIVAPRLPKGLPRPISRADLHRLLLALDGMERRAVALGAYAGLRVSEAGALDWMDVDTENRRLRVSGKGRTRLVGLSPVLLDAILPDTGGNVVTAGGEVYSSDALQRRVNRAIRRAGVDATYHQLRHRFGTMALAGNGGNLLAVSRAMGHSSPATTAIYAATSDSDLDVIAEAVAR